MRGLTAIEQRGGAVGWVAQQWLRLRRAGACAGTKQRQLALVETLSLGGRRQMMLVRCGTQHFLVGANGTDVQCIVTVGSEAGRSREQVPR